MNKNRLTEALKARDADPSLPAVLAADYLPAAVLTLLTEGSAVLGSGGDLTLSMQIGATPVPEDGTGPAGSPTPRDEP